MSVVHSGSNKQFASGWEAVFGGGKPAKAGATKSKKKAAKPAAKPAAKAKAGKKKSKKK
jgi:hypothetical protein